MLEERRDVAARVQVINAELNRIGEICILYENDANGLPTEKRIGICVDPADSSLAKLLQAYTAMGGNPFDISMFLSPDSAVQTTGGDTPTKTMPGGGVLAPEDIKYAYDQGVTDGDVNLKKYKDSRQGGKNYSQQEAKVLGIIQRARKWIAPEIRYKRTRLEEMIIKMADLREQLDQEVEDIIWATYGEVPTSSQGYVPERFNDSLTAGNIAYFFDTIFRVPGGFADDFAEATNSTDPSKATTVSVDNKAEAGKPGSLNTDVLGGYPSLMTDEDDEDDSAM